MNASSLSVVAVLFVGALGLSGCEADPPEGPDLSVCADGEVDVRGVCETEGPYDDAFGSDYWLLSDPPPSVDADNIFRAVARYGGGCGEHLFTYEVGAVGHLRPPTALGLLYHEARDPCLALVTGEIEVDLTDALEGFGCIGRVVIGTPDAFTDDEQGGGLVVDIEPVGCGQPHDLPFHVVHPGVVVQH